MIADIHQVDFFILLLTIPNGFGKDVKVLIPIEISIIIGVKIRLEVIVSVQILVMKLMRGHEHFLNLKPKQWLIILCHIVKISSMYLTTIIFNEFQLNS